MTKHHGVSSTPRVAPAGGGSDFTAFLHVDSKIYPCCLTRHSILESALLISGSLEKQASTILFMTLCMSCATSLTPNTGT